MIIQVLGDMKRARQRDIYEKMSALLDEARERRLVITLNAGVCARRV